MEILFFSLTTIALFITVMAIWKSMGVFRITGTIIWMIWAFFAFNLDYPPGNAYLPIAVASFGVAMTVIMIILTIMEYYNKLPKEPTHDEVQRAYTRQILAITKPPEKRLLLGYPQYERPRRDRSNAKRTVED